MAYLREGTVVAERLASVPTSVTGLWGEAAVVLALRGAGLTVEWDGGMTRGGDLRAAGPSEIVLHLQVKTSTAADGRVAWKQSGQAAREWATRVERDGGVPLYVFVHFPIPAVSTVDLEERSLKVTMPKEYAVTAASPEKFAEDVDAARAEYGQRFRQKNDRYGKAGERLSADSLQYPVYVESYWPLDRVLANLL